MQEEWARRSPGRKSDGGLDGLGHFGDADVVAAVERPLLDLGGRHQARLDQDPHVFAQGRVADAQLLGQPDAAHPVGDQVAVDLRREVPHRVLQPLQDLQPPLVGERAEDVGQFHFGTLPIDEVMSSLVASPATECPMPAYPFVTLDVFTDTRFGGNPLAVFTDARGLTDDQMLSLAAEMNLSETTFVLPPADPANTARIRIYNRTAEMPFAGHPTIGTGWVLSQMGRGADLGLEVPAGIVGVTVTENGATMAAPRPLSLGAELPVDVAAACAGIAPRDIVVS